MTINELSAAAARCARYVDRDQVAPGMHPASERERVANLLDNLQAALAHELQVVWVAPPTLGDLAMARARYRAMQRRGVA